MNFKIRKATRKKVKIKLGIQGPAGSGKTYSALLLAYGITNDWDKICVIDTENQSSELYGHLGDFNVLPIEQPFAPEQYVNAIDYALKKGNFELLIIDSVSHEWDGPGGILEIHSEMTGNSFTNWGKLTPRHNKFINKMLFAPVHLIGCMRTKTEYALTDKNGKAVPEKIGMKGIQREGLDYEFTTVFDLNIKHKVTTSKDRTGLFMDQPEFTITKETGKKLVDWANEGIEAEETEAQQPVKTQLKKEMTSEQVTVIKDLLKKSTLTDVEKLTYKQWLKEPHTYENAEKCISHLNEKQK